MAQTATKAPRKKLSDAERAAKNKANLAKMYPKYAKRVTSSLNRIGSLSRYKPTAQQADVIIGVIQAAAKKAEAQLRGQVATTEVPNLPL